MQVSTTFEISSGSNDCFECYRLTPRSGWRVRNRAPNLDRRARRSTRPFGVMKTAVATLAVALGAVSCATPPLTLHLANERSLPKSLRISEQDWQSIRELIPAEYGFEIYGA